MHGSALKTGLAGDAGHLWGSAAGTLLWDSGTETDIVSTPERRWGHEVQAEPSEESAPLSRAQVVARILDRNPSATLAYLAQFEDEALRNYLDHLETAERPRGPRSRWVRRGDSSAIVGRESEY